MSQPEDYFDPHDVSDYSIFGVRYVLLPTGRVPDVSAIRTITAASYTLWTVPSVHYLMVVQEVGTLREDRFDVGALSISLQRSGLFDHGLDPVVEWTGVRDGYRLVTTRPDASDKGTIGRLKVDLDRGFAEGDIRTSSPLVTVLSASSDPGWHAWVKGHPESTVAVAPALVGVRVPAGSSAVLFRYEGFRWYPELVALSLLVLVFVLWSSRRVIFTTREVPADESGGDDRGLDA